MKIIKDGKIPEPTDISALHRLPQILVDDVMDSHTCDFSIKTSLVDNPQSVFEMLGDGVKHWLSVLSSDIENKIGPLDPETMVVVVSRIGECMCTVIADLEYQFSWAFQVRGIDGSILYSK